MKQTAKAKEGWNRHNRDTPSIFPFQAFPGLVEMINKRVPTNSRVALFGGGRGYLAKLLEGMERTFVNLDVAKIENPFVPTIQHDIEEPIERTRLIQNGEPLVIVTPFSLEYTDHRLTTATIADILAKGEIYVCLRLTSDSPVVDIARQEEELLNLLRKLLEHPKSHETASGIVDLFSRDISRLFKMPFDAVLEATNRGLYLALERMPKKVKIHPSELAMVALIYLEIANRRLVTRQNMLIIIDGIMKKCQEDLEINNQSHKLRIRTPEELAAFVDKRLKLIEGERYEFNHAPIAIIASFERT
ncbi:MAG: hypothetical protein Q7S22_08700 [Candidatus Micrarchaeota archaeon]|nr:hypothetical protein [Candidatus Micrarchaeota archaeon]